MILRKTARKRRNNNLNNNESKIYIGKKAHTPRKVEGFRNAMIILGIVVSLVIVAPMFIFSWTLGLLFSIVPIICFFSAYAYHSMLKKPPEVVYITSAGVCYHKVKGCSGADIPCSREYAIINKKNPCSRCCH